MTKGVLLCARACLSRGDQTVRAECGFETQSEGEVWAGHGRAPRPPSGGGAVRVCRGSAAPLQAELEKAL